MMVHLVNVQRFWAKVHKQSGDGCWLWTAARGRHGYGVFKVGSRTCRAHRVAMALHLNRGIRPEEYVLHTCDVKACVRPGHLQLGDQHENMRQLADRGPAVQPKPIRRAPDKARRGEANGASKLTRAKVDSILAQEGQMTQAGLAKQHGVSRVLIGKIFRGEVWRG